MLRDTLQGMMTQKTRNLTTRRPSTRIDTAYKDLLHETFYALRFKFFFEPHRISFSFFSLTRLKMFFFFFEDEDEDG